MKNKTYIYAVLDKSGSMSQILDDSIGGFNHFLNEQKALPNECEMSIKLFNQSCSTIVEHTDLQKVQPLTRETYSVDGMTALYDAIGSSIDELSAYLSKLNEEDRPNKVLIVILTDGQENSSKEYTSSKVSDMIKVQREGYNWEFIFLAANQDALSVADSINISKGNSLNFNFSASGANNAYASLSSVTRKYRSRSVDDMTLTNNLMDDAGIDNSKIV